MREYVLRRKKIKLQLYNVLPLNEKVEFDAWILRKSHKLVS